MRTVTIPIIKLGLVIGNTINIKLVNTVGDVYTDALGSIVLDSDVVLDSDTFSIELLENENIDTITFYKLTLPNTLSFNFLVPVSTVAIAHDLYFLLNFGCARGVIDTVNRTLDKDFVKKLDIYFSGENPHFTNTQKVIVEFYEYYADEVKDTAYTIDIIQLMDEYLATLGV